MEEQISVTQNVLLKFQALNKTSEIESKNIQTDSAS